MSSLKPFGNTRKYRETDGKTGQIFGSGPKGRGKRYDRQPSGLFAVRRKGVEFVGEQRVQMPLQGICTTIANLTDRRETVGSSPTVTTENRITIAVVLFFSA